MTERKRKSNVFPVIAYPEGVKVGKVLSGRSDKGAPQHVAFTERGYRLGTFATLRQASDAVLAAHRES